MSNTAMSKRERTKGNGSWPAVERRKPGWARDWQSSVERDKALIARTLHDETGGLLVAAVMDISWAESHLEADPVQARKRMARARSALDAAIGLNRKIIEELRPTLLENFGLVSALQWHFSEVCKLSGVECELHVPDAPVAFTPVASIALYRVAESLLSVVIAHEPRAIALTLALDATSITLRVDGRDLRAALARENQETADTIASVSARVDALGGDLSIDAVDQDVVMACRLSPEQVLNH